MITEIFFIREINLLAVKNKCKKQNEMDNKNCVLYFRFSYLYLFLSGTHNCLFMVKIKVKIGKSTDIINTSKLECRL